ncbi:putative glutathione S transferase [Xylaria cf. heliscus]|nr:putative glutathione S transferase [Xylaria cf. heliscus]
MANESTTDPKYTFYVYYTRYSSWGARVQLALEYFAIPHTVKYFNFTGPEKPPADLSMLPVLDVTSADGEVLRIRDSLAIVEYLAEQYPLWPADAHLRALARAATAAIHSGFAALRDACPTNFLARYDGPGIPFSDAAANDVAKLLALWDGARVATKKRLAQIGQADDGFLFGRFSIADAFFWPVLWRLRSYNVPLTGISQDALKWMETMWNDPVVKAQVTEYFRQAQDPQTEMPRYDDLFKNTPNVTFGKFTEDWVFKAASV